MKEFSVKTASVLSELASFGFTRICTAIGVFDGVHLGHCKVMKELLKIASETNAVPVAVTFDPHPRCIVSGMKPPPMLISLPERIRRLGEAGAKAVTVIRFNRDLSILSPEEFLKELLHSDGIELTGICVGSNWHFGYKAAGSCADIQKKADQEHFLFSPVPELEMNGKTVSSSAIRQAVSEGDLHTAEAMLGRRYGFCGCVVHGMHLAAEKLGHPTANIFTDCGVLPPFGVYAAFARIEDEDSLRPAVASIGLAPTIRNQATLPRIEVHIPDFHGDLYGKELHVELIRQIRAEQKFNSIESLKAQIYRDSETALKICREITLS